MILSPVLKRNTFVRVPDAGFGLDLFGSYGGSVGGLIEGLDAGDGRISAGGAAVGGALQGGSMGAKVAGPYGAVVGGILGALTKGIGQKITNDNQDLANKKLAQATAKAEELNKNSISRQIIKQFPTQGIQTPSFKQGGSLHPSDLQYRAEDAEVVEFIPGDPPSTDQHGSLKQLSSDMVEVQGDSHSDPSGGVGMKGGTRVFSDRIEIPNAMYHKIKNL